jgi:hypothetical protein
MANDQISGGDTIETTKLNNVIVGDTAPSGPQEGDLWTDTTVSGIPELKVYDGTLWISLVPPGTIQMWSGTLATIPDGWALCDGTGGTPNLLDRFVISVVDAVTNPGAIGGSHTNTVTLASVGGSGGIGGTSGAVSTTSVSKDLRPKYFALAFIIKL